MIIMGLKVYHIEIPYNYTTIEIITEILVNGNSIFSWYTIISFQLWNKMKVVKIYYLLIQYIYGDYFYTTFKIYLIP